MVLWILYGVCSGAQTKVTNDMGGTTEITGPEDPEIPTSLNPRPADLVSELLGML